MALGAERDEFDVAILASGDTDLEPAIDAVQSAGKRVENAVWRPERGYARPLKATGQRLWVHRMTRQHYDWVHDPTDYTYDQGDRTAL